MAVDVVIPKMGMTMESGTLVEWLVADGAQVTEGQALFHLVTEKLDCDVEAEASGMLVQLVGPDTTLEPGGLVGRLLAAGETPAATAPPSPSPSPDGPRRAVSPIARKLAESLGVDLAEVRGSGPGGRITREDVESAAKPSNPSTPSRTPGAPAAPPRSESSSVGNAVTSSTRLIGMRGTIAKRMTASLAEMAQLTLFAEADVSAAVKLRRRLSEQWAVDERSVPTYTDLVIKAAADSLAHHPALNATVTADAVNQLADIHIGLAVALDDGLVAPVLRHTDRLSLSQIAQAAKSLAEAARRGEIGLDDLAGQTFSVTALGSFGIDGFTPVINPPNVAILGIGRIKDVAIPVAKRRTKRRRTLTLSLTFDHRAVDGAPAARFLGELVARLESPLRLLG